MLAKNLILTVALMALTISPALADMVELTWSPNTEPDLAGYKIFFKLKGVDDYDYNNPIWIGTETTAMVEVPGDGKFVARAYDDAGNESIDSDPALWDKPPDQVKQLEAKEIEGGTP